VISGDTTWPPFRQERKQPAGGSAGRALVGVACCVRQPNTGSASSTVDESDEQDVGMEAMVFMSLSGVSALNRIETQTPEVVR